jgi:hypothetical protein
MATHRKKPVIRKQEVNVMKAVKTGAVVAGGLLVGTYVLGQLKK